MMKRVVAGALMGAGALWAMNSMTTRSQKKKVRDYAGQMAGKVAQKANEILK